MIELKYNCENDETKQMKPIVVVNIQIKILNQKPWLRMEKEIEFLRDGLNFVIAKNTD